MPTMIASRDQAVTSSTAAQASAVTPSGVCTALRSERIRASTGKAVTESEMPRKSEKTVNGTSAAE
jgi:hypothetical protein